jgi:hypothetical protein
MSFLFALSTRRLQYYCLMPVVVIVGMSVFVNYMASRDDFRRLVWYQNSGLGDRFERIQNVFANFEWLDLSNLRHRSAIDLRLNQNVLVGAAIARLELGQRQYAYGATLSDIAISMIPRALWPDKPAVGGGGDVVTKYTGIRFARGTSVGAGQVFEFYVNFGTLGVVGGFFLFGCVICYMDLLMIRSLQRDDQRRFLFYSMIGLSLLQPGGNLVEIAVSAAGAAAGAYILNYFLDRANLSPRASTCRI